MLKVIGSPFPGDAYDIAMLTENIAIRDLSTPGTLMRDIQGIWNIHWICFSDIRRFCEYMA